MNILTAKSCLVAALTGLILPLFSSAASFDCAKAATNVETLICSDAATSQQDEQLAQAYKAAMEKSGNKELLRQRQREWLKEKRNACKDVTCLAKAYQSRIQELEENVTSQAVTSTSAEQAATVKPRYELTQGKQFQLCRDFLDLINRVEKKSFPNCHFDYPFDDIAKKQGFRDIEWVEVNRKDYKALLKNRFIYRGPRVSEKTAKERAEKFEANFERATITTRMWTATFDLNGDRKKDKVFKEKTRNCGEDSGGYAFIAREDGVLDNVEHRRTASNDLFLYQGKSYFYQINYVGEWFGMDSYVTGRGLCSFKEI